MTVGLDSDDHLCDGHPPPARCYRSCRSHRTPICVSLLQVFIYCFLLFINSCLCRYQIQNAISYASRPLWDTPDGPKNLVPHFYALGVDPSPEICRLHGYGPRSNVEGKEVWDAVLLSTELDLLEIRMNELDSVVDRFFIIESDREYSLPSAWSRTNAARSNRYIYRST